MDKDKFTQELLNFLKEHGVVDFCFIGVSLDNNDLFDYDIGSDKLESSNVVRIQRMIGCIEFLKRDIMDALAGH